MNCGLGSLKTLKDYLLAEALRVDTSYDTQLTVIGRGVAAMMDRFCNRGFAYTENDSIIFTGDRPHYYLPRFPINESASITVQMRYFIADDWADIGGQPISWNPQTGLLHFGYTLGRPPLQVKVTYTGGYWFDTTEEQNDSAPAGATALPDDVRLAWLQQCAILWQAKDKLGVDIVKTGSSSQFVSGSLAGSDLSPIVRTMLQGYVRYQLT